MFSLNKTVLIILLALLTTIAVYAQDAVTNISDNLVLPQATEQEVLDFMNTYNITQFRNQAKLTLMHKKNKLMKLGKESVNGDIQGIMKYDAHIRGFGGDVIMTFHDYQDFNGWIINGASNVYSRMDMNGYMYGVTTVSDDEGNVFATVDYSNIKIVKGNVGAGTYGITLAGKETYWLEWDKLIQPVIRNED